MEGSHSFPLLLNEIRRQFPQFSTVTQWNTKAVPTVLHCYSMKYEGSSHSSPLLLNEIRRQFPQFSTVTQWNKMAVPTVLHCYSMK